MDSETSSLRYLDRSRRLHTVIGTGLFDFGYEDGPADRALLQHPLGVLATPELRFFGPSKRRSVVFFRPQLVMFFEDIV